MGALIFKLLHLCVIFYYSFIFKFIDSRNSVQIDGCFLGLLNIKGRNNNINLNGRISRARIKIDGENNSLLIEQGVISNLTIQITGNNHSLTIRRHRGIANTTIIMLDGNNTIYIDEMTGIGGARMVVGGLNNYINIGKYNMISDKVEIWATDSHSILDNTNRTRINSDRPIELRDHVWIGSGVCILKGVTINKNAILGMGSVVINDVPENSISIGNPNKIVKNNIDWCIERI